jgi:hypothetical protein
MHGSGALFNVPVVALAHVVCNPKAFAASLMPSRDTPSVVAKQSFDRESKVYSLS